MPVSRHLSPEQLISAAESDTPLSEYPHLATCESCRRQVAQLSQILNVMASDELEMPPMSAIKGVLAMLPPAAPQPSLLLRLQAVLRLDSGTGSLAYGLRGGQGKSRQLLFSAGAYEIDVRLRPNGNQWTIMGQLLGDAEVGVVRLTDGKNTFVSEINVVGEFTFQSVPAATYTLIIAVEDIEMEISNIVLEQ
jgi:hypothetical protein